MLVTIILQCYVSRHHATYVGIGVRTGEGTASRKRDVAYRPETWATHGSLLVQCLKSEIVVAHFSVRES